MAHQATNAYGVVIPLLTASPNNVGPVGENLPIPVGQLSFDNSNALTPKKMAVIIAATREIFQHSTPTIENIIKAVYFESLQAKLDELVLATTAGDATKSAGLRYGINALTASASADPLMAMLADVRSVVSAVSIVAANSPIILVTDPVSAIMLKQWRDRVPYEVFGSSAVADGDLIAIATNAIASSLDEQPKFEISREATLHMSTTPAALSVAGTPANVVSAPIRSLWQTDSIGAKITLGASWIRRSDSAVAWTTGGSW